MPNCDFYALAPDAVEVLDFVFAQSGWKLVELTSEHDRRLRSFHTTREVLEAYPTFQDFVVPLYFHLHAEAMRGRVTAKRISFKPGAVPGATFRYDSRGWGLIQLYLGNLKNGRLSHCHTNHFSERGARRWEPTVANAQMTSVDEWDWKQVEATSARLNRFIRRVAPGKLHARPVLRAAWNAQSSGELTLDLR